MTTRSKGFFTAAVSCALAQLALLSIYIGFAAAVGADMPALAMRLLSMPVAAAAAMAVHLLLSAFGAAAICAFAERRARREPTHDEPFDELSRLRRCGAI